MAAGMTGRPSSMVMKTGVDNHDAVGKVVTKLMKKHWAKIKDADRRNMVGRYSALLIQVKDSRDWSEPVDVVVKTRQQGAG
jgi:predicted transcriptional regulator